MHLSGCKIGNLGSTMILTSLISSAISHVKSPSRLLAAFPETEMVQLPISKRKPKLQNSSFICWRSFRRSRSVCGQDPRHGSPPRWITPGQSTRVSTELIPQSQAGQSIRSVSYQCGNVGQSRDSACGHQQNWFRESKVWTENFQYMGECWIVKDLWNLTILEPPAIAMEVITARGSSIASYRKLFLLWSPFFIELYILRYVLLKIMNLMMWSLFFWFFVALPITGFIFWFQLKRAWEKHENMYTLVHLVNNFQSNSNSV